MGERPVDIAQDGHLFPRTEVLEAVAGADWRERAVRPLALLCLAQFSTGAGKRVRGGATGLNQPRHHAHLLLEHGAGGGSQLDQT